MWHLAKISYKLFIKPFYQENAGNFLFFIIVMFLAVGHLNGAGTFDYHYALVIGMLTNVMFFGLVCFVWSLYARKCFAFVDARLKRPDYLFLFRLRSLPRPALLFLLGWVQVCLFMPILLYSVFIVRVASMTGHYQSAGLVLVVLLLLIAFSAWTNLRTLEGKDIYVRIPPFDLFAAANTTFVGLWLQCLLRRSLLIVVGIKLYTCGLLYLAGTSDGSTDYDLRLLFFFFIVGIIANGSLMLRLRDFEQSRLLIIRSAPISLVSRWLNHAMLWLILLIPEMVTIAALTPRHLAVGTAIKFAFAAYGCALALNSISFLGWFSRREFVMISFLVLNVCWLASMNNALATLAMAGICFSALVFVRNYHLYEQAGKANDE